MYTSKIKLEEIGWTKWLDTKTLLSRLNEDDKSFWIFWV